MVSILNSTRKRRRLTRTSIAVILTLGAPLAYLPAASPAPQTAAPSPTFEVASVKPAATHMMGVKIHPGGRVTITSFPLKTLIQSAFGLSYWQISGGEEWMEKDQYDLEAKPSVQANIRDLRYTLFDIEDPRLREMVQALLVERFQLKFHRETKTGDIYLLEKSGRPFRLHPLDPPTAASESSKRDDSFGSIGYVGGQWSLFASSLPQLAKYASSFVLRVPVLDRTGITGSFNYRQRQPDVDEKYSGDQSDSFLAFLAEVGLKLERSKGPVEMFVIDHASKPTAN